MRRLLPALLAVSVLTSTYSAEPAAEPFALRDVTLLPGPFQQAMETDKAYLLRLEPDRFLAWFRKESGLTPKAEVYGGWENQGVAGHVGGHYLSALAQMYSATGDPELLRRLNYMVDELAVCQEANGNGYVAAIPGGKKVFAEVAAGDIRAPVGFSLNGLWVPWYTIHKLMAGLRDAHVMCGNARAKVVLVKLADWTGTVVEKLTDEQVQQMLNCEQGGMCETLADVSALTGDPKYLELAKRFSHHALLDPLSRNEDILTGRHANTQIPKFIGFERIAELGGGTNFHSAAANFWTNVVSKRSWCFGGNSSHEYFMATNRFGAEIRGMGTVETCNTYNMLRLTHSLFLAEPSTAQAEYYERAMFNHVLSSQEPRHGGLAYYTAVRPGHFRVYSSDFDAMWCCVGTGIENHAKYGEALYYHHGDTLWFNQLVASELRWTNLGVTLRQETRFPDEDTTRFVVTTAKPVSFTAKLRYPTWVRAGALTISVNGKSVAVTAAPGDYVSITREWKSGDTVEVKLPMSVTVDPVPYDADYVSLRYGPIVLAGQLGTNGIESLTWNSPTALRDTPVLPMSKVPVFIKPAADIASSIHRTSDTSLTFRTEGLALPEDVTLVPLSRLHFQRYALFWKVTTEPVWREMLARIADEEKRELVVDGLTVDRVRIGEQQPEVDHALASDKSASGVGPEGTHWRDAREGGWFSYRVRVPREGPAALRVTYWGGESGPREFDIQVDGTTVATQKLGMDKPGEYFSVVHPLSRDLLGNKDHVTVRFQAHPGKMAGGVFDLRVLNRVP